MNQPSSSDAGQCVLWNVLNFAIVDKTFLPFWHILLFCLSYRIWYLFNILSFWQAKEIESILSSAFSFMFFLCWFVADLFFIFLDVCTTSVSASVYFCSDFSWQRRLNAKHVFSLPATLSISLMLWRTMIVFWP